MTTCLARTGREIPGLLPDHALDHRWQATMAMRRAGLEVPRVVGLGKQDWATYGEQPSAV